jgi:hypothetical protein
VKRGRSGIGIRRDGPGPLLLAARVLRFSLWLLLWAAALRAEENAFVYAQLRHGGDWDPHPGVWSHAADFLRRTTSVEPPSERRVLTLDDPELFDSPFLALLGKGTVSFSEADKDSLRDYLAAGGFLFIDDSAAERKGPFARSVLPAVESLFPGAAWEPLPREHAVYRAFFLARGAAGRRVVDEDLRGLKIQDRVAAVYSANDLHGAWARDPLGRPLYTCEPGGEVQRLEAHKLLVNVVIFSLTGTYKSDAIHQPFLERKLRP